MAEHTKGPELPYGVACAISGFEDALVRYWSDGGDARCIRMIELGWEAGASRDKLTVAIGNAIRGRDALLAACKEWDAYFKKLDELSEPGDPIAVARREYHAKRIEATRAAIASAEPGRPT